MSKKKLTALVAIVGFTGIGLGSAAGGETKIQRVAAAPVTQTVTDTVYRTKTQVRVKTKTRTVRNTITKTVTVQALAAAPDAPPGDASGCDPNYSGCVPDDMGDVNCSDLSGSVEVIGEDIFGLDRDGDGIGCDS